MSVRAAELHAAHRHAVSSGAGRPQSNFGSRVVRAEAGPWFASCGRYSFGHNAVTARRHQTTRDEIMAMLPECKSEANKKSCMSGLFWGLLWNNMWISI